MTITKTLVMISSRGTVGQQSTEADGTKKYKDVLAYVGKGCRIDVDVTAERGTVFTSEIYTGGAHGTAESTGDGDEGGSGGDGIGLRVTNAALGVSNRLDIALGGGGGQGGGSSDSKGAGGNAGVPDAIGTSADGEAGDTGGGLIHNGGGGGGGGTSSARGAAGVGLYARQSGFDASRPDSRTDSTGGGTFTEGGAGGSVEDDAGADGTVIAHSFQGGGGGGGGVYGGGGGGYVYSDINSSGSLNWYLFTSGGGGGGGHSFINSATSPITLYENYTSSYSQNTTTQSIFDSKTFTSNTPYLFASASTLSNFTAIVGELPFVIDFNNNLYNDFHNSDALLINGLKTINKVEKYDAGGSAVSSETISGITIDYEHETAQFQLSASSVIPSGTTLNISDVAFETSPSDTYINSDDTYQSNNATFTVKYIGIDLSSNVPTAASTTNFTTSTGADLNTIFQPISLGATIGYNTGFEVSGNDLKNIFAAKTSATGSSATGFQVSGNDLNTIFEPLNSTQKLIVNTATSGNETIYLPSSKTMTVILVGGGGGGSTRVTSGSYSAGNGGAGGEIKIKEITTAGTYDISYSIGAGGAGSTTEDVSGNTGGTSTVTIGGTTYTASGGAGGNVGLDGVGSQGTAGDDYNYNHGGTAAVKDSGGNTYINETDGQGGFVLTVDGIAYNVGGGGGGGKTYITDDNEDETSGGIGGGNGGKTTGFGGTNGGGGGGGAADKKHNMWNGGDGGAGFLCIVVHDKISP
jgi:hypothetical protein